MQFKMLNMRPSFQSLHFKEMFNIKDVFAQIDSYYTS
jgi:hypothetical protein